jgi:hypothetical protein
VFICICLVSSLSTNPSHTLIIMLRLIQTDKCPHLINKVKTIINSHTRNFFGKRGWVFIISRGNGRGITKNKNKKKLREIYCTADNVLDIAPNLNIPGGRTQVVGPLWALSKIQTSCSSGQGQVQIQRSLSTCNCNCTYRV